MKVLITGGSGMVGSNILENHAKEKHTILAPTSNELNLLDRSAVDNYILKNKPSCIVHAAGKVGGIQANISNPISFLSDNLEMGLNIIMSAYSLKVPNFINIASSCMYPRNAKNPLSENMILTGQLEPTNEGYALAKISTTKLCEYIAQTDRSKIYSTVIPCNLYGRYDSYDPENSHLLPAIIEKIHSAHVSGVDSVQIWGDGNARREFMYAKDLADFIFYALDNIKKIPQNINVGLGFDYSITEYYKAVAEVIGFKGSFQYDISRPVGMKQKLVDINLLKSFGWHHKTTLSEGIKESYEYYKSEIINGI